MIYKLGKSISTALLCTSCYILVSDASVINVATTTPPDVGEILEKANMSEVSEVLKMTRRIINGEESADKRPYMVYLQLPTNNPKYRDYRRWMCGGVIIHEEYILTSAACIEDAKNFYVVSGTFKHSEDWSSVNNLCIKNGAKKAIWKCVPRNYVFDGHENDNIRWMNNDIAVVKVEDEFDFERRVRGCDYIPKPICYNNQSASLENPGNNGVIAGWGSTLKYGDWVNNRREMNVNVLRETPVNIISKRKCKRRWGARYANIIDNYMICTKDLIPDLSEVCQEKYVDCKDIMYSGESSERRMNRVIDPSSLVLHNPFHNDSGRRANLPSGRFCENDHGGPLIAYDGREPIVIGIISACLVKERTNKCYGPFLYTSVYKNRVLLNCAVFKNKSPDCNKMYRSSITHTETVIRWADHPDGPAKNEIAALRRASEHKTNVENEKHFIGGVNTTSGANTTSGSHAGRETNKTSSVNGDNTTDEHVISGTKTVKEVHATTGPQATTGGSFVDTVQQHGGLVVRA